MTSILRMPGIPAELACMVAAPAVRCSGGRSAIADKLPASAGFRNVCSITDGFEGDIVKGPVGAEQASLELGDATSDGTQAALGGRPPQ